jgi:rRNA biogenesis protein RRP5
MDIRRAEIEGDAALLQEAYPVGTMLDAVRIVRVEAERGLVVEVRPGLEGFVHVSNLSLR